MNWDAMANRMLGAAVRAFSSTADAVTWLAAGVEPGTPLPNAVFDTAHIEVDADTGAQVSSVNPTLGVRLSDLPNTPTSADRVRVRGVLYRIADVVPDGVAGSLLILKKV